jgi:regulator of protease activity HflC (stomatin/prohibitin superfamily)
MGWIVTTVLLGLVASVAIYARGVFAKAQKMHEATDTKRLAEEAGFAKNVAALLTVVVFGLWLLITGMCSINQIDAGKIGLVRTFGEITGQQDAGLNFKAPYQSVTEVNGRIQKKRIDMSGGDKGSAVSIETQPVYAKLEINYQLQLDKAKELYTEVGAGYYNRIIEPRVQQAVKAETVKYKTIEIAPKREEIREAVRAALDKQLDRYGIDVVGLTIRDLDFANTFMAAIEDKQAATEQAKAAQEKVAIVKADAEAARQQAKGEADALRIKGAALKQNPKSLEQMAIEKLNPSVQLVVIDPDRPRIQQIPGVAASK